MTITSYHQGDINFVPIEAFGKSVADISTANRLRAERHRLLIQEGEITGHHHMWLDDTAVMERDPAEHGADWETAGRAASDVLSKAVAGDFAPARLYADADLAKSIGIDDRAPVIGFLVAYEEITIRHATADGRPTGEHSDIKLPAGAYLVTGKREWTAGDERRVQD